MNSSGFVHYVYDPREEADRAAWDSPHLCKGPLATSESAMGLKLPVSHPQGHYHPLEHFFTTEYVCHRSQPDLQHRLQYEHGLPPDPT